MWTTLIYAVLGVVAFLIVGGLIDYAIRTWVTMTPDFAKLYSFLVKIVVAIVALVFVAFIILRVILPLFQGHGVG